MKSLKPGQFCLARVKNHHKKVKSSRCPDYPVEPDGVGEAWRSASVAPGLPAKTHQLPRPCHSSQLSFLLIYKEYNCDNLVALAATQVLLVCWSRMARQGSFPSFSLFSPLFALQSA
jgi:hypothetical protein